MVVNSTEQEIDRVEHLEETAFSLVTTAIKNHVSEIAHVFEIEEDLPQDIAEDMTREAIEKLGVSSVGERLYGKVDLKKSIYLFLPEATTVALMLDAKAEQQNGDRTATIQMSQTSMCVRMKRGGSVMNEQGALHPIINRNNRSMYVVTIIAKYVYEDTTTIRGYALKKIILACIPSGILQNIYNPTHDDTIWLAGRNAPTRGEDFRVRLNFKALKTKADWRIKIIDINGDEVK